MLLKRLIGEKVTLDVVARPRPVAGEGRHLAVRAGDRQSRGQCPRCNAGWRQADRCAPRMSRPPMRAKFAHKGMPDGRLCAGRGERHRHRHSAGHHRQDLRAVLLDQGSRQGHGPRALDRLRHRQADRRLRLCGVRPGQTTFRIFLPRHVAGAAKGRALPSGDSPALQARRSPRPNASPMPISPGKARFCWSRTRKACARSMRAGWRHAATQCWKPPTASRRSS